MKFVDRLRQSTAITSTAVITLSSAVAGYRTVSQAIADGDLAVNDEIAMCVESGSSWEISKYRVDSATQLTRLEVLSSWSGGAAVTFPSGNKEIFCTVPADFLAGVPASDLPALTSVTDTTRLLALNSAGELLTVTAAVLKAYTGGSSTSADTTAPTLSSPAGSSTGTTTASGTVSTNEGNGTLYWLVSTSSSATTTAVKAGSSKTVSGTGSQSVTASGLTASTTYYIHYLHRDAAGNDSAVASTASFTTAAVGDTTAPTLSSPTGAQTGATTASGSVGTNEANGTLYRYVSTNSTETAATVKAANLTSTVTATGVQNVTFAGLTASTVYYAHYVHRDAAGNDSAVASSASFTTAAAEPQTAYTISGYNGNAVKSTIDASQITASGSLKGVAPGGTNQATVGIYWNVNTTNGGTMAPSAKSGWGTSNSTPPAEITQTQNQSSGSSINGMTPMTKAAAAFGNNAYLWVPVGSGTTTWYFWIKPVDGAAYCVNPSGTTVTGA